MLAAELFGVVKAGVDALAIHVDGAGGAAVGQGEQVLLHEVH